MLIETDVILAVLNPTDPANLSARRVLNQGSLVLSPFTLLEVNLLARAGRLEIRNFGEFAADLGKLIDACSIRILNDKVEYHSTAKRLEDRFRLTFFDSLHAAVSKVQREIIVSFDRAYDRLRDEGVKRLDPRSV